MPSRRPISALSARPDSMSGLGAACSAARSTRSSLRSDSIDACRSTLLNTVARSVGPAMIAARMEAGVHLDLKDIAHRGSDQIGQPPAHALASHKRHELAEHAQQVLLEFTLLPDRVMLQHDLAVGPIAGLAFNVAIE